MKYHINPGTGRVGQCRAKSAERCQFSQQLGTVVKHYESAEEAQAEYEKMNKGKTNTSIKKPKTPAAQKKEMAKRKEDYLNAVYRNKKDLTANNVNSGRVSKDYSEAQRLNTEYGLNNDLSELQKKIDYYAKERKDLLNTKKRLREDYADVIVVLDAEEAALAAKRQADRERDRRDVDLTCGGAANLLSC